MPFRRYPDLIFVYPHIHFIHLYLAESFHAGPGFSRKCAAPPVNQAPGHSSKTTSSLSSAPEMVDGRVRNRSMPKTL